MVQAFVCVAYVVDMCKNARASWWTFSSTQYVEFTIYVRKNGSKRERICICAYVFAYFSKNTRRIDQKLMKMDTSGWVSG